MQRSNPRSEQQSRMLATIQFAIMWKASKASEIALFSGHTVEKVPHCEGTALILSKVARKALIELEAMSSRIITEHLKPKNRNWTWISSSKLQGWFS